MNLPVLDFAETMAKLPSQQPENGLDLAIRKALFSRYDVVIVLDDDPTGTQTVNDVPVITEWTVDAIQTEMKRGTELFYLLTNSRAFPEADATAMIRQIGQNIVIAAGNLEKRFLVIIRGDSTLRGHYPEEEVALAYATGMEKAPHFLIPAFFEGGRYTINDVHYVREGKQLIPAAQTPFARDHNFRYRHSDLKLWVQEKSKNLVEEGDIVSLTLEDIRAFRPHRLKDKLRHHRRGSQFIVNATDYTDLKRAALAIFRSGAHPLLRTSASFIKAILGQEDRLLLQLRKRGDKGGLIVVGSHVPKTTAQLAHLRANNELVEYELNVHSLLFEDTFIAPALLAQKIAATYEKGDTFLLYTSRKVIITNGAAGNLNIAATVSGYLEEVVAALPSAPSFLLTKGGITSSRIATESLGVKRAMALGQVQPGVPTWELGPESKFPGMPFIIFPGNVGGEDSLSSILQNTII